MLRPAWQCGFLRVSDVPHEFGQQVWEAPHGLQIILRLDDALLVERTERGWRYEVRQPRENG
jgi:hypothetical protein